MLIEKVATYQPTVSLIKDPIESINTFLKENRELLESINIKYVINHYDENIDVCNAIYIYASYAYNVTMSKNIKQIIINDSLKNYKFINSCFDNMFDDGEQFNKLVYKLLDKNNIVIGYYIPSKNVFLFRDYTHTYSGAKSFSKLFKLCVETLKANKVKFKPAINKLKIGMDVEFEIFTQSNKIMDAYRVIDNGYGKVGTDANSNILELRPDEATKPEILVKNLYALIFKAYKTISKKNQFLKISPLGNHLPLGMHIHLNIYPNAEDIEILSDIFGFLTELSGKVRGSYKNPRAIRRKKYGLEYRAIPSIVTLDYHMLYYILKAIHNLQMKIYNNENIVIKYSKDNFKNTVLFNFIRNNLLKPDEAMYVLKKFYELQYLVEKYDFIDIINYSVFPFKNVA